MRALSVRAGSPAQFYFASPPHFIRLCFLRSALALAKPVFRNLTVAVVAACSAAANSGRIIAAASKHRNAAAAFLPTPPPHNNNAGANKLKITLQTQLDFCTPNRSKLLIYFSPDSCKIDRETTTTKNDHKRPESEISTRIIEFYFFFFCCCPG